jgi:predicted MFS family arabinose efflux permease
VPSPPAAPVSGARSSTRTIVVLMMLGCGSVQAFGRFTFAILLPAVKADLLSSYGKAGYLGTLNVGAYLLGTAAVSIASLRVRGAVLVKAGLVLSTAGLVVLAAAPSLDVLIVGMLLAGAGGAVTFIPAVGLVTGALRPDQRGLAVGLTGMGIGFGIVFATQLTNLCRWISGDDGAWRPIWWIEAGMAVVLTLVTGWLLRVPATPTGSPPRLSALRRVPRWGAITATYFCYGFGYILFTTYVVAALERDAGFGHAHASAVFAVFGAASSIGGISVGRLSDRIGRRPALMAGYALAGLAVLSPITHREPWVMLGALAFGFAFAGNVAVIGAYIADHARPAEFGAAFGAVTLFFGLAQTVGPQLGGSIADHAGSFTWTFLVSAVAWFIGALTAGALAHRRVPAACPVEPVSPVAASNG